MPRDRMEQNLVHVWGLGGRGGCWAAGESGLWIVGEAEQKRIEMRDCSRNEDT